MNEIFEIHEQANGDIILRHIQSMRHFCVDGKSKFKFLTKGFRTLDAKEIIYEKIKNYDFTYQVASRNLYLKFAVVFNGKTCAHDLTIPESLITNDYIKNAIQQNPGTQIFSELFCQMLNKINNLEAQIEELNDKISSCKDIEYYSYHDDYNYNSNNYGNNLNNHDNNSSYLPN